MTPKNLEFITLLESFEDIKKEHINLLEKWKFSSRAEKDLKREEIRAFDL